MLDKEFEMLRTYDWGQDRKALAPIDQAIIDSAGDEKARAELEKKMIDILESDASRNGKDFVCRKLKVMGTEACVPTLAKMLGDETHAHMARFVLQTMQGSAATDALMDALSKSTGKVKAGVIGSLGARGEEGAVSALAELLGDADSVVAKSAASALGAIGSADAAKALGNAKAEGDLVHDVVDSQLTCAEKMLAGGNKLGALAIYKTLKAKTGLPKHIGVAATRGMLACAGASKG